MSILDDDFIFEDEGVKTSRLDEIKSKLEESGKKDSQKELKVEKNVGKVYGSSVIGEYGDKDMVVNTVKKGEKEGKGTKIGVNHVSKGLFEESYIDVGEGNITDKDESVETDKAKKEQKVIERMQDAFKMEFSEDQLAIIKQYGAPLNVLSGAGSGKTTVLVAKMLYREMVYGEKPLHMLAITFSRDARIEMQDRYVDMRRRLKLKRGAMPTFRTFHALFLMLMHAMKKYKKTTVLEGNPYWRQLSNLIVAGEDMEKSRVLEEMFTYKGNLINKGLSKDGVEFADVHYDKSYNFKVDNYIRVMERYEYLKEEDGAIDFDDMQTIIYDEIIEEGNMEPVKAFHRVWGDGAVYIDEYQDISKIQRIIMDALVKNYDKFTVIGDDDQCWHEDSLIDTVDGVKKMKDIEIGDKVSTMYKGDIVYLPVTYKTDAMKKAVLKVVTKSGKEIRVTSDHKCFVYDGKEIGNNEKKLSELYINEKEYGVVLKEYDVANDLGYRYLAFDRYLDAYLYIEDMDIEFVEYYCDNEVLLKVKPAVEINIGDLVPVEVDGESILDEVVTLVYEGDVSNVYHLEVAKTGILIADSVVTHNSIYSWRGSDPTHIIDFPYHYKNAERLELAVNYRCKENILRPILTSISKNERRVDKDIRAFNEGGHVELMPLENSYKPLIDKIMEEVDGYEGIMFSEVAILVRQNTQRTLITDALIENGLPVDIGRESASLQKAPLYKNIMELIDMVKEKDNKLFVKHARKFMPQMSNGLVEKYIYKDETWYFDICEQMFYNVSEDTVKILKGIYETNNMYNAIALVWRLVQRYYRGLAKRGYGNFSRTMEVVRHMLEISKGVSIERFRSIEERKLSRIQIWVGSEEAIKVETLHSVKGLEYDTVYLIGVNNNILPDMNRYDGYLRDGNDEVAEQYIEEERRLFYVGWTRAKERLIVSYDKKEPSMFLKELDLDWDKESEA